MTTEKMAVQAPMPSAMAPIAMAVNAGLRRRMRAAWTMSLPKCAMGSIMGTIYAKWRGFCLCGLGLGGRGMVSDCGMAERLRNVQGRLSVPAAMRSDDDLYVLIERDQKAQQAFDRELAEFPAQHL